MTDEQHRRQQCVSATMNVEGVPGSSQLHLTLRFDTEDADVKCRVGDDLNLDDLVIGLANLVGDVLGSAVSARVPPEGASLNLGAITLFKEIAAEAYWDRLEKVDDAALLEEVEA